MTRKIKIDRSNFYRAILTDTLPYELPLFFSNESLFLEATKKFRDMPQFVHELLTKNNETKPLSYQVQKGGGAFRKITVIHPSAQLKVAEFYGRYDTFIINACSRSNFSLRYPSRIGSHYFQKQYQSNDSTDGDCGELDLDPMSMLPQRRWASTYFSYKSYTHIYKFFLSEKFNQLEKQYKYMLKVDIAHCFESIYTHSIAWALRGKEFSKQNRHVEYFETEFDKLMRASNWGETNGIPIGAEVSRVFAEIILQSVDIEIERTLGSIIHQVNIERYVDDYFAFANNKDDLDKIKKSIEKCASTLNLHLNESKTEILQRPLIAKMAIARSDAMSAANEFMINARKSLYDKNPVHFSHRAPEMLISKIRSIARSNDTEYSSLASPVLAVILREISRTKERINPDILDRNIQVKNIIQAILSVTEFLFHTDIRSSTTHKVAKIFYEVHSIVLNTKISVKTFEEMIVDFVKNTLQITSEKNIHGPEIINLLVAAESVCKIKRPVTPTTLNKALSCRITTDNTSSLSYFDLVSALYFSKKYGAFSDISRVASQEIESRIKKLGAKLHIHTDATMLFFDYLSCPYIKKENRIALFSYVSTAYGFKSSTGQILIDFNIVMKRIRFVTWEGSTQFRTLLERRELHPAYDL